MLFIDRRSSAAAVLRRSNSGAGTRSVMLRASVVAAGISVGAVAVTIPHPTTAAAASWPPAVAQG